MDRQGKMIFNTTKNNMTTKKARDSTTARHEHPDIDEAEKIT